MAIGTAGFTAASALYKMELMGQKPSMGPIVVTGSTGGVGSMAVAMLAKAGYEVIAVTGKENGKEYLEHLGATQIERREFVNDNSGKSLLRPKWAGAIDTVGGNTLATLLKGCMQEGCVVSTGLVDSPRLESTVFPFILNGINLLGIGSAEMPTPVRQLVWHKITTDWNIKEKLSAVMKEVSLEELNNVYIDAILGGNTMGRIVVKI
jgi:putative YhdH/YhfP family quinone oxidoreductase